MKFTTGIITAATLLALSAPCLAEIYETTDEEGNTVFTDVPTQGAKKVKVQTTNTADAPPDIPPAPAREKAPGPAGSTVQQDSGEGDVVIIGDAHNERVERAVEEHRREEAREAVRRHETGNGEEATAEPLRRIPPAMQPHTAPHHRR